MASHYEFSKVTPQIEELASYCTGNSNITPELYLEHNVYCGLRDLNGKGVLTGLTEISEIVSKKKNAEGIEEPCEGELYYRGIDVRDIIKGFMKDNRFGFEETTYLLLFGKLPDKKQLDSFVRMIGNFRQLPSSFVRDIVLKSPSDDIMNTLARCVLTLYAYDDNPNDLSIPNVLRQSLELIALFPMLVVYSYHAKRYYDGKGLIIHRPHKSLSIAENILHLLREDSRYTALEARVLDLSLVLHAEHGGGNNSTFTTHVVTSSGTDTYSAITAALSSLKGPKHGGANLKVMDMFDELKREVKNWEDEDEVNAYLEKLLNKEAFDRSGLIYGMGHAVYSVSDPRAQVFKGYVEKLAKEKGMEKEFNLYASVERLAAELIAKKRRIYKGVSANIDFYSGFCYSMLGLPIELYTPLFAVARISGWSAHRIEELINAGKIIRPAYMSVSKEREYINFSDR